MSIHERGNFRLCPIYDNGASLLSDLMMDYPMECDIYEEISNVKSKTICDSFYEQLEIAEALFGQQIVFHFKAKDITEGLDELTIYDKKLRDRVELILREQMRRYRYLFSN